MKKRILLFTAIAGVILVTLRSQTSGEGAVDGNSCTGAETGLGNPTGCNSGGGCHATSATSGIDIAIELDSAGTPVTQYVGGHSYTVKITGTNTTSSTLAKFGFQLVSIVGTTAQAAPTNAGTFPTSVAAGLPSNTRYTAANASFHVTNIVEQSTQLSPSSGTGGTGTTYSVSIPWTAPAAGTGSISFWVALNALHLNGTNDPGDLWNTNHVAITELVPATGVAQITNYAFNIFPNPVTDVMNVQMENGSNIPVRVFDINGRTVATETVNGSTAIRTASWAPGMYYVAVGADAAQKVVPVVKQ